MALAPFQNSARLKPDGSAIASMPFTYDAIFIRARKRLNRGECPEYKDLKYLYEQGLEQHLGLSQRELSDQCREDFGLAEGDKWR